LYKKEPNKSKAVINPTACVGADGEKRNTALVHMKARVAIMCTRAVLRFSSSASGGDFV